MKSELEVYMETGVLGGYRPERAVMRKERDGVSTAFRDASCWERPEGTVMERDMVIQGRRFHVTSVFPGGGEATPTAKLLSLIDADLEKSSGAA